MNTSDCHIPLTCILMSVSLVIGIKRSGSLASNIILPLLSLVEVSGLSLAGMGITLAIGLSLNQVFIGCLSIPLSGTVSET